jgi:peptidyl-dipeptidase Dcp
MRDLIARSRVLLVLPILTALFVLASVNFKKVDALRFESVSAQTPAAANANPLLANWVGPYGGVPPFDRVQIAYFKPALETAMSENLAEVQKIANNPAAPTFENTIVELERSGSTLDRVGTIYGVWGGTMARE